MNTSTFKEVFTASIKVFVTHKQIQLLLAIFYQAGPVQLQAGFDGGLKSCLLFIRFLNLCLEFAFSKEGGYSTWV